MLAGGGPEEARCASASASTPRSWAGWSGADLARVYASADVFMFASRTDTFGQVMLEAQASGLPVVAVDEGGPASLIEHGETGLLTAPDPDALASALVSVTGRPEQCLAERLRRAGLAAARERTWEGSMAQLARGYGEALRRTSRSASGSQVA